MTSQIFLAIRAPRRAEGEATQLAAEVDSKAALQYR
jgi:hypothetical protein